MAEKQLINGKAYDWSSVTINVSGMETLNRQKFLTMTNRNLKLYMAGAEVSEGSERET